MSEKIVTVNFSRVVRVTDNFVRVRANNGNVIQVDKPHDTSLRVFDDGGGNIKCPQSIIQGVRS